ncbi:hypothetical protein CU044_3808 [Streptomyces sp. L-9-10]|nr:hypothetical protein CU044_3808 [Streptomyces sp. L-9-10]
MQRCCSHLMISLWSPSVTPLNPIRPLMNSNLTVSDSLSMSVAILSNSSTDIWTARSAITVMVHLLSGGHQRDVTPSGRDGSFRCDHPCE